MKKRLALALCLLAVSLTGAAAGETWPARPVKHGRSGLPPGGPTDLFAILIAQSLSQQTGETGFIENAPGAGGNVGAARAAQSAAGRLHVSGDRRQHHQQPAAPVRPHRPTIRSRTSKR